MLITFNQVLILLIFIAIGFALGKTKIVQDAHTKGISGLLVYAILTSNVFKTFAERFTVNYLVTNYRLLLISAAVICIIFVAAHFGAKLFSKNKYARSVYEYSLIVPNYGYMGYALAEAFFGQTGLMDYMVYTMPLSIFVYTVGIAKLTKQKVSLKGLCNPVMIAMALGIVVGISGLKLPQLAADVVSQSAACMAPLSMMFTGIVISGFSVKSMFTDGKNYIMAVLRLVVIPLAVGFVMQLFFDMQVVRLAVLCAALPCGMNTVIFPRMVDENCQIGAGLAVITALISCITIPVILAIFQIA